jgi:uncharacterized protein
MAALAVSASLSTAHADAIDRGAAAIDRGDYLRAAKELAPPAARGDPRALGLLGLMYEYGYGVPQAYDTAFNFYCRGATGGDPFAQAQLGLMYDKGHGVHQDFIQAYKWLDLAAAHAQGRSRDAYTRFRDAVASKMSNDEIVVGQRLATRWVIGAPIVPEPARGSRN